MLSPKKYILYAYIKPYDLKLCLVFPIDSKIRFIQEYIEDTMRNFRSKYKVGRIEHKKTSSILLPDFKIGEALEDKDEIIVYSIEYGLTKKNLNDKSFMEDIDKLFIGKKVKRESRITSRKISIDKDKNYSKISKGNKSDDEKSEENDEESDKDNNDNDNENNDNEDSDKKNENDESSDEEDEKKNIKQKKKEKNSIKKDDSSNSGEDNSEDLKL